MLVAVWSSSFFSIDYMYFIHVFIHSPFDGCLVRLQFAAVMSKSLQTLLHTSFGERSDNIPEVALLCIGLYLALANLPKSPPADAHSFFYWQYMSI
jgi:hypothetical protein